MRVTLVNATKEKVRVCVCVCVCVYRFIYPAGNLNLNTHTHGDSCHGGGPKLRSPWVQKLINHTEWVF